MKQLKRNIKIGMILFFGVIIINQPGWADDICVFNETADDVVPNIFILLDTGAGMEQIMWHDDYDNSIDHTPNVTTAKEVLDTTPLSQANGFFHTNGYGIIQGGQDFYLVKELNSLELDVKNNGLKAGTSSGGFGTWTINGKTISLPATPGGSNDKIDGVSDQAAHFRYSANYLNWIFFSGEYTGGGSDFDSLSRLYFAKKAMMTVGKFTAERAKIGLWYLNSDPSQAQPIQLDIIDTIDSADPNNSVLDSAYVNNVNGMKTPTTPYSPLAYGLAAVAGKYGNQSAKALDETCQKNFIIVVSPGVSSDDLSADNSSNPTGFSDFDGDSSDIGEGIIKRGNDTYNIPTKGEGDNAGTTYLDDVAHYIYTHDMITYSGAEGTQNITTYTVGFMGDLESKLFLINTSNNGNGHPNLYDSSDPEYGKYHFEAASPEELATAIMRAINDILNRTSSFTAPVVPVTRTTSGNRIYLSFFKPDVVNFWEGNVAKYGINTDVYFKLTDEALQGLSEETVETVIDSTVNPPITAIDPAIPAGIMAKLQNLKNVGYDSEADFLAALENALGAVDTAKYKSLILQYADFAIMQITDKNDNAATWPNGAIKDTAEPFWQTKDWATVGKSNYIHNADRNIYTWLNQNANLSTAIATEAHAFTSDNLLTATNPNGKLTITLMGSPFRPTEQIINFIRGADVFDEDGDGDTTENRAVITGDVLHSEPAVLQYNASDRVIFFGANDGMLHAVADADGAEKWAFIPPDILHRLKDVVEGVGHQNYVDLSPKVYVKDANGDGKIEATDNDVAIIVCGERKGGDVYFALDITDPDNPKFLWRISSFDDSLVAKSWKLPTSAAPTYVIPEMGESWSEPRFGRVKTSATTVVEVNGKNQDVFTSEDVIFIGGGYRADNSSGNTVLIIKVRTGEILKQFSNVTGMDYSIASRLAIIDENNNGYIDKLYVGDLGGQIWRFGKFTDSIGLPLPFPETDENITNWSAHLFFKTETHRKFFYRPNVTVDEGFDAVFIGSGDRENACDDGVNAAGVNEYNRVYMIKDIHSSKTITDYDSTTGMDVDLVNITNEAGDKPKLKSPPIAGESDPQKADYNASEWGDIDVDHNDLADWGWYINMASSEKVLAEGVLFAQVLYITTFTLNDDPCVPGGDGTLYAFDYLTAESVLDFDNDGTMERSLSLGGGIPSKPVLVIPPKGEMKLFISVGSTLPDPMSDPNIAGIKSLSGGAGIIIVPPKTDPLNFFFRWWRDF